MQAWMRLLAVAVFAAVVSLSVSGEAATTECTLPYRVIGWGDSLTANGGWMNYLSALGIPSACWEAYGLWGEKAWNAADGIVSGQDGSKRRFRDWLDGYTPPPNVIIIVVPMWGSNDVKHGGWASTMRPFTAAAFSQMVDDALSAGFRVVAVAPPPYLAGGVMIDILNSQGAVIATEPHGAYAVPSETQPPGDVATYNTNLELLVEDLSGIVAAYAGTAPVTFTSVYDHWLALPGWPNLCYYYNTNYADGLHPGLHSPFGGEFWRCQFLNTITPSGFSGNYHVAEGIVSGVENVLAWLPPDPDPDPDPEPDPDPDPPKVPSLSDTGMMALAGLLGLMGVLATRRIPRS